MEAVKDTSRLVALGAISTLLTYIINKYLPNTPEVVVAAILTLVLVYTDSSIHHGKAKLNGILPW